MRYSMEWIKDLKIAHKLMVLIILALIFIVLIGSVGFGFTQKANNSIKSLYNDRLIPIKDLSAVSTNTNACNADLLAMLLSDTYEKKQNYYLDIQKRGKENTELLKKYEATSLTQEEKEILPAVQTSRDNYVKSRNKVVKMAFDGKSEKGLSIYRQETKKIFNEYDKNLSNLVLINKNTAEKINQQNEKDSKIANIVIISVFIISFGFLIVLGIMISKMITEPITIAVEQLETGAEEVAAAAVQLSAASQKLAEGSSEQAAAIQETSASIEESDSMVKQNADNTQEAAVLSQKTKDFADKSNNEMEKMVQSMEELKKSSDDIAKIIKVIDEIAFQTNILALNAAVEAARAGDAGKGFAVVAEEVRNLAQKSAQATKDTASIIEKNIYLSGQSAEATAKINEDIKEINEQAQKVNELLNEIAVASKEQAQGIDQIDKAVQQMEQVLQANASTAEESASASRELSGQAASVKEIVNTLYVMVEGQEALKSKLLKTN